MIFILPLALFAVVSAFFVARSASKSRRPFRCAALSVLSGASSLFAVNAASSFTGVSIECNVATAAAATLLGLPGVVALLLIKLLCGIPAESAALAGGALEALLSRLILI